MRSGYDVIALESGGVAVITLFLLGPFWGPFGPGILVFRFFFGEEARYSRLSMLLAQCCSAGGDDI